MTHMEKRTPREILQPERLNWEQRNGWNGVGCSKWIEGKMEKCVDYCASLRCKIWEHYTARWIELNIINKMDNEKLRLK